MNRKYTYQAEAIARDEDQCCQIRAIFGAEKVTARRCTRRAIVSVEEAIELGPADLPAVESLIERIRRTEEERS